MAFHQVVMRPWLLAFALGSVLVSAGARAEPTSHGAMLPSGSREVGKDRFQSPSPYAETLKFYWKVYGDHFPRKTIADLPGIRAVHISNPGHGGWEGLNVYELNGVTRIFVLPREASPKGKKSS
jgi:hypothetical protein